MSDLQSLRVSSGFDVHPLVAGRKLILGGVHIPYDRGLEGHSDGDVVAHAVTDAVLGIAGAGDIGSIFSSDNPELAGADSMGLLRTVVADYPEVGIVNIDVIIMLQQPHIAPYREQIIASLADALGIEQTRVTVRATTTDRLGFIGRGEGAAAQVVCLGYRS